MKSVFRIQLNFQLNTLVPAGDVPHVQVTSLVEMPTMVAVSRATLRATTVNLLGCALYVTM
jgi:hypothetical protein